MDEITLDELKTIRNYAYLSAFVYHNESPNYPNLDKNWKKKLSFAEFLRIGCPFQSAGIPCKTDDYDVNAEIFVNDVTKELAIVYRGTANVKNIIDAVKLFFNQKTIAEGTLEPFVNYARFQVNAQLKYNILHIGHSLGGYLASLFALKKNERCYAFDAPSGKEYVENNYPAISEDHFKNVTYIDSNWSIVHNIPPTRSQKAQVIPFQVHITFSKLESNLLSTVMEYPLFGQSMAKIAIPCVMVGLLFTKQVHDIDNIVKAIEQRISNKENNLPDVVSNPIHDAFHFKIKLDNSVLSMLEVGFKISVQKREPNNIAFCIDSSSIIYSNGLYMALGNLTDVVSMGLRQGAFDLERLNLHLTDTGTQMTGSRLEAGSAQNSEALFYDFHLVVKGENIAMQASVGGGGSVTVTRDADPNRKCLIVSTPDTIGLGYWTGFRLCYAEGVLVAGLICKIISVCELAIDITQWSQEFENDDDHKSVEATFIAFNEKIRQKVGVITEFSDSGNAGVFYEHILKDFGKWA